jgi:SPP1 gp7 family putative phage head morphogenesis protein
MKYTDKQIEELISGVYAGKITVDKLPEDLYLAIGDNLESAIREGWGPLATNIPLGTPDVPLYNALRENVYIFSAAKTYQQVRDMAEFIAESTSYTNFKVKAMETYGEYNVNWLKAEYNTAVGQAQQANQWKRIQDTKETFPYITYSAVIDSKTSEICRPLDGVTLPVDDPFWNNYTPLNHFNCRCTLEKIDKYEEVTITPKSKIEELNKELAVTVNDEFRMNSGKDGYIFDPNSHPYFKVAPKDKDLAKKNFNLPIPPPIEPPMPMVPQTTKAPHRFAMPKVKELGVQLDERLYDLLEHPIDFIETYKGACADPFGKYIKINFTSDRWKGSYYYRKKVIEHELAHAAHVQRNIIRTATGEVSEEYAKHFNGLKKMVKNDLATIQRQIDTLGQKINYGTADEVKGLLEKYGAENVAGFKEQLGATADSLMALSNARYGWGHDVSYMRKKAFKEAEMFAHSAENYFSGNKVFEDLMPEVYKESIKFISKILNP